MAEEGSNLEEALVVVVVVVIEDGVEVGAASTNVVEEVEEAEEIEGIVAVVVAAETVITKAIIITTDSIESNTAYLPSRRNSDTISPGSISRTWNRRHLGPLRHILHTWTHTRPLSNMHHIPPTHHRRCITPNN